MSNRPAPRPTTDRPGTKEGPRPMSTTHRRTVHRRERLARAAARRQALRRHLRAALAAIALAAALLTGMQLYAANGIAQARQAALQSARTGAPAHAYSTPAASPAPMSDRTSADVRTDIRPEWVTRDTGAPYSATDPSASPLDLPRCTASPTTPMPCLAWNSADSSRVVVLEEDGSLTGLVRQ